MDKEKKESEALLEWYDSHRRKLPWREDPTPYHVWISEIMLQQTRVEAVRGYYARFLDRFPDIRSLAEAEEDECLKLWEGLGYYSRVRNMQKAAREIMSSYGGEMPRTASELRKLPGIGPYTSAAIASIAFGEKIPAVDGNLLRIFSRLALYEKEIRTPAAASGAHVFFLDLMPDDRPGDFNQALMDLGSSVCVPGPAALCRDSADACPLSSACKAFHQKRWASLPVMPVKKARRAEKKTILVIRDGDRVMLRRRPSRGLLAGLYEFPGEEGWLTAEEAVGKARSYGCQPVRISPLRDSRHIFTHREWLMHGYEIWTGSFPEEKLSERSMETGKASEERQSERSMETGKAFEERKSEKNMETGKASEERQSERNMESGKTFPAGKADMPFFVSVRELQERYAVPGAYAAYLSVLTGEL